MFPLLEIILCDTPVYDLLVNHDKTCNFFTLLFCRLHDRKMCVLGLCALIDLEQIPQVLNQVAGQILPAFILLFNGLKRAYACHAEHENDSDDDDEAEEDEETGMETETLMLFCMFHFLLMEILSSFVEFLSTLILKMKRCSRTLDI